MYTSQKNTFLKDEYLQIEQLILNFDERAITIKAWSVTLSMAGLGAGFLKDSHILLLLAGLSSIIFWIIEGFWKEFQYAHYERCGEIEEYFAGKRKKREALAPLQIAKYWLESFKKGGTKRFWMLMCLPHVALPHIVIAGVGIILFILVLNGTIEI